MHLRRMTLKAVLTAVALVAGAGTASAAAHTGSILSPGERLVPGADQYMVSANGLYRAYMQADGNFVLYRYSGNTRVRAVWATKTNTVRRDGLVADKAVMEPNGDFVLYTAANVPVCSTRTSGNPSAQLELVADSVNALLQVHTTGRQVIWQNGLGSCLPGPSRPEMRAEADRIMRMPYRDFVAYKRSPARVPYFDWSDDGCSGPAPGFTDNLFNGPCQLHDFGYRNYGKGLELGRDENTRNFIDDRFYAEMRRLCTKWNRLDPRRRTCTKQALAYYGAVRNFGRGPFYG